jgi:hypothetical protein
VRAALEDLLAPVDDALAAALEALHLQEITDALAGLPATVEGLPRQPGQALGRGRA